ncbi:RNA polymerase, sigma subunit, ECF family [Actinokineospora alba]|uniref:RNA polymerase, sigma subunit, ECF family n=1 Tax=Actinokineospora alba TaxID=504798 RepID=A0A1H0JFW0_9PSEU|nr:RNA polymerase sigma-70 factor [Actinokineospora alba]TDP68304.1 RNA polymerase ECF family sigma subunit [Actinokineospora alba]SDH96479.1 RNA polymerase sigma-70 factor, ECF subfamily [Actinokineospora alba]SDO42637.1 RNA polymerase, sigma subunit, ECF family [Actinokineospora alba]
MDDVVEFEAQRSRLFGIAYRMLGSATEAEDIVQETYLRWSQADGVDTPSAWLATVVTNLCLNHLTSARARRERYVGPWLPESVATADGALGPVDTAERRESVSFALLVLLEQLTPVERAVFVLREAFAYPHADVAAVLGLSEANSRQLHRRARQRLAGHQPRTSASRDRELLERFLAAASEGDVAGLERMLAADATSWADGGGKVNAARRPVVGANKVARYLIGLLRRFNAATTATFVEVNGDLAVLGWVDETPLGLFAPQIEGDRVVTLRIVANPDKLTYLAGQLSRSGELSGLQG